MSTTCKDGSELEVGEANLQCLIDSALLSRMQVTKHLKLALSCANSSEEPSKDAFFVNLEENLKIKTDKTVGYRTHTKELLSTTQTGKLAVLVQPQGADVDEYVEDLERILAWMETAKDTKVLLPVSKFLAEMNLADIKKYFGFVLSEDALLEPKMITPIKTIPITNIVLEAKDENSLRQLVSFVALLKKVEPDQVSQITSENLAWYFPEVESFFNSSSDEENESPPENSASKSINITNTVTVNAAPPSEPDHSSAEEVGFEKVYDYDDKISGLHSLIENLQAKLLEPPAESNQTRRSPKKIAPTVSEELKTRCTEAEKKRTIDRNGKVHWRLNGKFCKAPPQSALADAEKQDRCVTPSPQPTRATVKVPEAVKQNYTDADKIRSVDRSGNTHSRTPNGKFCKAESAVAAESAATSPPTSPKSEPTRATVKVPKAVKQNYTDADKTRTVDRDGTTHWRTPNGLFCKAPQSAVAAESAGMSPPTSSTTPKPEPTRARATVRVPEAVKQNYTDADKTRSVDRDGTTHWRTPNGKFCKAESAVAAEPPAKPQPTTTTSRPEPARATVNVAERVQVNYTDADKTRSVDRNGITRWRTPNGRFCSAPEYFSSSSSGYSSFGSNYGFGSFGGAGGGYRQDANGRWHGANGRFCKAPW